MNGEFHSVLVPIDLSPSSDRVIRRAALLPLAKGARLTLLHVIPRDFATAAQRIARRDAKRALASEAKHLARSLRPNAVVRLIVTVGAPATEIARFASRVSADLIVMGRCRTVRGAFLGSTAERVIRRARLPVLVVRPTPRAHYRRPAVALEPGPLAPDTIRMLLRIVPTPWPRLTIVHAFDRPYEGMYYRNLPADETLIYGNYRRGEVATEIDAAMTSALQGAGVSDEDGPRWNTVTRNGSPRVVVPSVVKQLGADLLVVGTRGRRGIAYVYLGSVAGELVRNVECDVLVVPSRQRRQRH